ncbi:hypothetical protein Sjap_000930 [Stephania japonica]|uniref:Uncharacterized protein n=1 Tax=Stephania japonica TaxID=461633 RepID=A0AAP0KLK1_9MAGN
MREIDGYMDMCLAPCMPFAEFIKASMIFLYMACEEPSIHIDRFMAEAGHACARRDERDRANGGGGGHIQSL